MTRRTKIVQTVVIAIAYVILTVIADMFGMAKGIVQIRISDALMVLAYFTPAAIPGLFIGCFVANTIISLAEDPMTGMMALSTAAQYYVLIGSIATLLGAIGGYMLRKKKFMVCIPPIIINTIAIPMIFKFIYRYEDSFLKCFISVGIGEIVSCGLLGVALIMALEDSKGKLFPNGEAIAKVEEKENSESIEDSDENN